MVMCTAKAEEYGERFIEQEPKHWELRSADLEPTDSSLCNRARWRFSYDGHNAVNSKHILGDMFAFVVVV